MMGAGVGPQNAGRGAALSRMFDYNSAADHILTILVGLLLAMFVVVMFLPG